MLFVRVGGQPGIPAAVGGLGELEMQAVAVFVFTRRVLAQCLPSHRLPSSPVVRVLLLSGSCVPWAGAQGAAAALPPWHPAGRAGGCMLGHLPGQAAQPE